RPADFSRGEIGSQRRYPAKWPKQNSLRRLCDRPPARHPRVWGKSYARNKRTPPPARLGTAGSLSEFVQLVPSDLRNLKPRSLGKAYDTSRENAQTALSTIEFLAALEQGLISDADAEKWFTGPYELSSALEQCLFLQGLHAVVEGAHAWQHCGVGIA